MRKVYQIGGHHYQIILSPDYNNTSPNYHWFFFEVSNNEADVAYTFEIASLEYIASNSSELVYTRRNNLCSTLAGNLVPIVTVTATESQIPIHEREFVVFSARVHPGECNSSWIMQGIIEYLHSSEPKAIKLREYFIFKLIPMLNPDGVIHGNSRFNLAGVDLNRVWDSPQEQIHPTVYHTKGVIQYMVDILKKRPLLFVDIHGHSKLSNIFLYGTSADRLLDSDDNSPGSGSTSICLSRILSDTLEGFCLSNCKFHVSKSKKGTARAVLKHQFGVQMSYTLETSFYGFHSGMYAGSQLSIDKLKQIGHVLCDALLLLREEIMMTEVMSTSR